MKKYLIVILIFFFLVVFEESFLSHFEILGTSPNLLLIFIFLLNFLESEKKNFGIFAGFAGGIILDFSSTFPMATFALTLGILSFLIKKLGFLFQKSNILTFSIIFAFFFFFYKISSSFLGGVLSFFFQKNFNFSVNFNLFLPEFFYNFLLALFFLILVKKYVLFEK
jgi:rod shape-determining protein MreD